MLDALAAFGVMREAAAIVVFYLSLQVGGINHFFLVFSLITSFCATLYFCGALVERFVMKTDSWFRITPGRSQVPPLEDAKPPAGEQGGGSGGSQRG